MVTSPTIRWIGSPNYRNIVSAKHGVVFHWIVGYLSSADARFTQPRQTATQYGVGPNAIHQYVKDELYAPGTGHNGANTNYISIEHEAGYQSGGTYYPGHPKTLENSAQLIAHLSRKHGWGKMVYGINAFEHNDFVATMCPGTLPWQWILDRANEINGHPAAPTNPGRLPANVGGTSYVDIDVKIGIEDTKELQRQLRVEDDGIAGPITTKSLQRKVGTPDDGLWGYNSTVALQKFVGAGVDGDWGPETTAKVRAAIAARKFAGSPAPVTTAPSRAKLDVDGLWGTLTTKALQRALNVYADGIIGPNTTMALQRKIGAKPDGVIGINTRKALQRHLRVKDDGIWGKITIRALQTRLNAGTF